MPHIIVKLWPGRSEEVKKELVKELEISMLKVLKVSSDHISISIEEVTSENWGREVYKKDIVDKENLLYKKPSYKYEECECE